MATNNTFDETRLAPKRDRVDFLAALRGEKVPFFVGLPMTRACIVHGIRYHHGFAEELRGITDEFTRALNARSIMSNVVPSMPRPELVPYCIWYPEVASEETYRALVERYPELCYQVARACAVAGYTKLYKELDILPEIHIAEEARESGNMAIFEDIMSKYPRFNVMDDYNRTINAENAEPGFLNGDTAVRWTLEVKQEFSRFFYIHHDDGFTDQTFNITEDMNLAEHRLEDPVPRAKEGEFVPLLYNPLPQDLPTVQKDLLICMAAHDGNVDRYARLRRPTMLDGELQNVIRGIYHHTMFAKWWSLQDLPRLGVLIKEAIHARFIMNNDVSREILCYEAPYLIAYPDIASVNTYRELARRYDFMRPQVLRACIVANYTDLFDELIDNVEPDYYLQCEASMSPVTHYKTKIDERSVSLNLPTTRTGWLKKEDFNPNVYAWRRHCWAGTNYPTNDFLPKNASKLQVDAEWRSIYNGSYSNASNVNLYVSVPEEWKTYKPEFGPLLIDYTYPPSVDFFPTKNV